MSTTSELLPVKVQRPDGSIVSPTAAEFRQWFDADYAPGLLVENGLRLIPPKKTRPRIMPSDDRRAHVARAVARMLSNGADEDGIDNSTASWLYADNVRRAYTADICIAKVNDEVGNGAFALCDLEPGDMIAEYTGLLREDNDEVDESNGYLLGYRYPMFKSIDALNLGNVTRFINHSYFRANVHNLYVPVDGIMHVVFIAIRRIPRRKQLLFNYGGDYWLPPREPPVEYFDCELALPTAC